MHLVLTSLGLDNAIGIFAGSQEPESDISTESEAVELCNLPSEVDGIRSFPLNYATLSFASPCAQHFDLLVVEVIYSRRYSVQLFIVIVCEGI